MYIILLIGYSILFIYLIISLIRCLKGSMSWILLFGLELFSIIISYVVSIYYDSLPGQGIMPGLFYFEEWFVSFAAMIIFIIFLIISVIIKLFN